MQTISNENIYSWNELYEVSTSNIERATTSPYGLNVARAQFSPPTDHTGTQWVQFPPAVDSSVVYDGSLLGTVKGRFAPAQEEQEEKKFNYAWTTHLPTAVQQATALLVGTKNSHYSTSISGATNAIMNGDRIARAVERTKEMRAMRRLK